MYRAGARVEPDPTAPDIRMPFYAMATNLSSGTGHLHSTGNIQIAVRANWPFPGLLAPFIDEEGHMLTDGTIAEPLPLGPMHRINAGPNVAARATMAPFGKSPIPYRDLPAHQRNARAWLPRRKASAMNGLPSFETLMAAVTSRGVAEDSLALGPLDMLLSAPIPPHLDVLAWSEHSRLKDQSYQWALGELEKRAASGDLPLIAAIPNS